MVRTVEAAPPVRIGKLVIRGSRDLQKGFLCRRFPDAVRHDPRQIRSGCRVALSIVLILRIQTVRRDEVRVIAADVARLLVHHHRKFLHASPDCLCDHDRRVVVRLQHQGIQQIPQPERLAAGHAQLHLRHPRRVGRRLYDLLRIAVFQRDDAGHDLCCARHRKDLLLIFAIEHSAGIRVHQNRRLRVELQLLTLLCTHLSRASRHTCKRQKKCKKPLSSPLCSRPALSVNRR